ncbi:hypothetical protein TNCV_4550861 [Trichonephila clavipes]|uniref:Uncharacterized protein n=1 Tax=Trichonephila clavipes TaxID=2585209 RepID=A0A8X6RYZ3_TRICX|nr:hypothetical protein TNCV_4550861 [Trichonephila clavipes]
MRVIFLTHQDPFRELHSAIPHTTENFKNFELFRTIGSTNHKLSSAIMKMLTIAPHLHIRYGMEARFESQMPINSTVGKVLNFLTLGEPGRRYSMDCLLLSGS